jgi:Arc/MetJ-type ribon-helix-helix transcriptional regulator
MEAYLELKKIPFNMRLTVSEWMDIQNVIESGEYAGPTDVMRDALRDFRKKKGLIKV